MSETRVFADGYRGVFQNQEDFLACLNSIGRNSFWQRKASKNLRLVAITSGTFIIAVIWIQHKVPKSEPP